MYLIVVEGCNNDADGGYVYQPYRLAATPSEASELMADYMAHGPDDGALAPEFFALYKEREGEFGAPDYFNPATLQVADGDAVQNWLASTGRV